MSLTPAELKSWRERNFKSRSAMAQEFGLSRDVLEAYEEGRVRTTGTPVDVPVWLSLAIIGWYVKPAIDAAALMLLDDDPESKRRL